MLYSALVMRHPMDGHPPIAVADLLTKDGTVFAILHFLETLQHHAQCYLAVTTSFNPALLTSRTKVYFRETVSDY